MKIKINELYSRDPYKFDIHEVAKQMVADGFLGRTCRTSKGVKPTY
jgi:hypothetical protein